MLIQSAVFGPLEVAEAEVFHLEDGLLGFDGVHKYALIRKEEDDVILQWFQSVDASVPCFVVFNPFEIVEGYEPQVEKHDLKALECSDSGDLSYLVIAVVPEDVSKTTVNLKSPILLNRQNQKARQVVLANRDYPIRFALSEE